MSAVDKPNDKAPVKQSEVTQFASAAFHAGIEKPINGFLQTVEKASTLKLPRVDLVDANGADGPNATTAQKGGELLGSVLPYIGSRALAKVGLSGLSAPLRSAASEGALAGAIMGGVLTPVEGKDNFWQHKAALAATDAATFGTLEGASHGLKSYKQLAALKDDTLLQSLVKGSMRGAAAGVPTGLVNAEAQAISNGNSVATPEQFASSVGQFAAMGTVIGAVDSGAAKFKFKSESRAETESKINDDPNHIVKVDKTAKFGEGDEGVVYSNGDGSLTKVFNDKTKDLSGYREMFDTLKSLKISTPKIYEVGKTEEGYPAVRLEQIGDNSNLKDQLFMHMLSESDYAKLPNQYYGAAEALLKANKRIDWQAKNMKMHNGKLYIFDPSFMKDEELSRNFVDMVGGNMIGPRPAKYQ